MRDTTPEMMEKMHEMMRAKTPEERFKMGCSMYETSKYLVTRAIVQDNPNISESELRQQLFLKFYGNDFNAAEREQILKHLASCCKGMSPNT